MLTKLTYFSLFNSYLHVTCDPPILHGNLTCDTIFIQHNGLVKIGSVAPDIIHQNVKTCRDNIVRNRHFLAPEWGTSPEVNIIVIYYIIYLDLDFILIFFVMQHYIQRLIFLHLACVLWRLLLLNYYPPILQIHQQMLDQRVMVPKTQKVFFCLHTDQ